MIQTILNFIIEQSHLKKKTFFIVLYIWLLILKTYSNVECPRPSRQGQLSEYEFLRFKDKTPLQIVQAKKESLGGILKHVMESKRKKGGTKEPCGYSAFLPLSGGTILRFCPDPGLIVM